MSGAYENLQTDYINWYPVSDYLQSGFQGVQGVIGIKGPTGGSTGYNGPIGVQGLYGKPGLAGITGIGGPGPQGPQGPQGGSIPIVNSSGTQNTNFGVIISQAGQWSSVAQKAPPLQYNPSKNLLRSSTSILCARFNVIATGGTHTLTAIQLQSGIVDNTGLVPIVYTIDSGANIAALYGASNLTTGDSWLIKFINPNANSTTFSAPGSITLVGPAAKTQVSFMAVLQYNGSSTFSFYY
jgi:hypothetical protein